MIIRKIRTTEELFQVGRLRYDITVTEMGLSMKHADHIRRTVIEPLDLTGHVYAAWDYGKIVGTIRTNYLRDSDIGFYYDAYDFDGLSSQVCQYTSSITTRLAVDREYRKSRLTFQLGAKALQDNLRNDILHDIVDCRIPLVPLFERLGYQEHKKVLVHPEFGQVSVLVLSMDDTEYLKEIRSPLCKILSSRNSDKIIHIESV